MSTEEALRAAFTEFPELRRLAALRVEGGWRFTATRSEGELKLVSGVRTYPEGWADAIGVLYTTNAQATRCYYTGEMVWKRTGSLVQVVDGLLELPAPAERLAPRLAIGSAPLLWIPRGR